MGNANNRRYHDALIGHVLSIKLNPVEIPTETEPMTGAIEASSAFDERRPDWIKFEPELSA